MTDPATASSRQSSDSAAWLLLGGLVVTVACLSWIAPMPIDPVGTGALFIACAALGGAALFYRHVRSNPAFSTMCAALMQMLLFSAVGSILSYLLARNGGALWDDRLATWDRALGFDWLAYVRWIDASSFLAVPLRLAYASLIPQIIVIVLTFGFTGRLERLRSCVLAAMLCGTFTILLSPLFPAVSNYVHLGLTAADFRHVDPWAGYLHLAHFTALRDGTMASLRFSELQGIITFPSYHAGLATVTLWSFARMEVAAIRWTGVALAGATILATPVDGGHYLVDVLAGMALAIVAIVAARAWVGWRPRDFALRALPFRHSHAVSGQ